MSTNFPTSLDSYTTLIDNVDDVLAAHPNDRGDAIEVLEAKVGVTNSAVATSHDYLLSNIPTQDTTGLVTNLNADKVDGNNASDFFPARSGDILISSNASVPSGWSDVSATYNDKFIRISSGTPLTAGGADTHTHGGATGSYVLTIADMPAHTHVQEANTQYYTATAGGPYASNPGLPITETRSTQSTGGGGGHTHGISTANNIPAYIQLKMYSKT